MQLFREGTITEEECKVRCEAIKAEIDRLMREAKGLEQDSGNGKDRARYAIAEKGHDAGGVGRAGFRSRLGTER